MVKASLKENITAVLAAALGTLALWRDMYVSPSDIMLLVVFAGLFALARAGLERAKGSSRLIPALLGALFALFSVLGNFAADDPNASLLRHAVSFLGYWGIFYAALLLAYSAFDKFSLGADGEDAPTAKQCGKVFFASWGILWLWFLLWLLYRWPGGVSVDSNLQLLQVLGLEPLCDHHPIIHTMIIKVFFTLGTALSGGDQNFGVAVYSAFQALMLSASFAWLITALYRERVKKWALITVLFTYILLPYHGSYSVTMWKDVWFGAIVLLLCVELWRLLLSLRRGEDLRAFDLALFFVSGLLMCLFRSNGLYAFVLLVPFITVLLYKKNRLAALLPVLALALAFIVKGPVYSALGIVPVDLVESLSVPGQHMARCIRDGADITPEQYELLSLAVDPQALAAAYEPGSADAVKDVMRKRGDPEFIEENKGEILKLWLELGLQNPGSYLRAQIEQTQGYWDPSVQYWVMAPDFLVSYMMELEADSKLPDGLKAAADAIVERIPAFPLTAVIFSIGTAVWVFLALMGYCLAKKRWGELLVFLPVLAVWGTLLIATPIYAEFRYIYSLFTTLPLLGILPFMGRDDLPM